MRGFTTPSWYLKLVDLFLEHANPHGLFMQLLELNNRAFGVERAQVVLDITDGPYRAWVGLRGIHQERLYPTPGILKRPAEFTEGNRQYRRVGLGLFQRGIRAALRFKLFLFAHIRQYPTPREAPKKVHPVLRLLPSHRRVIH